MSVCLCVTGSALVFIFLVFWVFGNTVVLYFDISYCMCAMEDDWITWNIQMCVMYSLFKASVGILFLLHLKRWNVHQCWWAVHLQRKRWKEVAFAVIWKHTKDETYKNNTACIFFPKASIQITLYILRASLYLIYTSALVSLPALFIYFSSLIISCTLSLWVPVYRSSCCWHLCPSRA